ncbi:beta-defensin 119 isoform X1 [Erinaceus europaeus]|uniref:Beta-defensin n=1 Tax=Erinaceus europaeus TaxID=9365 RepID=A0A1S3WBB0_ERIEU|nr:beta-defensin 119 isoform X1 [Erinaceus europaeus]
MKFLILFLAIFLIKEPMIPEPTCWMDGKCRLVCKNDEDTVVRCLNRKRCCVPSRYLTIQPVTIDSEPRWTLPLTFRPVRKKNKPAKRENKNINHG